MKYLAIDYGYKRTGLAVCDPLEIIVSPLLVIEGQKGLLEKISNVVKEQNAEAIVVGLPINMDDSQGPQAKLTLAFAEQLKKHVSVNIYFQDERLSSFGAEEKLAPAELTRGKKRKRLDAVAAAEILNTFLEKKHSS